MFICIFATASPTRPAPAESSRVGTQQRYVVVAVRITKNVSQKAIQVTDRFHIQKLALEALQGIRIKHRWKAMDRENQ